MKRLLVFAAILGFGYLLYRVVPAESRQQALGAIGAQQFLGTTVPAYLREKLTIPQNPVAKRKRILDELAGSVATIIEELDGVVPPSVKTAPLSPAVRQRVERARELAVQSESKIQALEATNENVGIFRKAAERVLDRAISPSESACTAPAS